MNSPNSALLLDTHVWIWLMLGDSELKPELVGRIEQAAKRSQLYISAISTWELSRLVTKGRIQLKQDVFQWIQAALNYPVCSVYTYLLMSLLKVGAFRVSAMETRQTEC